MVSEGEFQTSSRGSEDHFKEKTGLTLREQYLKYHPQILCDFEDEMERYWGRKWKANTNIGKLRMVLLHRPGKEFLSIGKPTPWAPHDSSLGAWRMSFKPDLNEMIEHHLNLVDTYKAEGVEVVIRKPETNASPDKLIVSVIVGIVVKYLLSSTLAVETSAIAWAETDVDLWILGLDDP